MSLIQIIGSKLFFKWGDILPLIGVFSKRGVAREGGGDFPAVIFRKNSRGEMLKEFFYFQAR